MNERSLSRLLDIYAFLFFDLLLSGFGFGFWFGLFVDT